LLIADKSSSFAFCELLKEVFFVAGTGGAGRWGILQKRSNLALNKSNSEREYKTLGLTQHRWSRTY